MTSHNPTDDVERRFPRRFLMAASAAVAATGVTQAITPAASAASASTEGCRRWFRRRQSVP